MARFLLTSLVLSVVATVVLNLVARRAGRRSGEQSWRQTPFEPFDPPYGDGRYGDGPSRQQPLGRSRVKVFAPWKAMLVGSLVLTILLNLLLAVR